MPTGSHPSRETTSLRRGTRPRKYSCAAAGDIASTGMEFGQGSRHLRRSIISIVSCKVRGGGGILIDCGANIGELGLWALARGMEYVAFEPEPLEARCIDLNVYGGHPRAINKALWNSNTSIEFFSKPEDADSSIIEMDGAQGQMRVEAVRLDTAIDLKGCTGPVILKLDGEGAEPEILEGATGVLPSIDFVTMDCGFERGREKSHTFVETNVLLVEAGFRLQQVGFGRVVALYRNANR